MSSMVIVVAALVAIGWLAFLVANGMRGRSHDAVAPNLSLYKTDDELENRRLDRVLGVAVILSAFLAVSLPVYYLGERNRQAGFEVEFEDVAIERGHHHVEEFACASCHGEGLVGGVASYVDARSGVTVSWAAPSLNDIFLRYDRDEVRFWLVYGRANSPMPAWGAAGNGPMNDAQIEETLDYLESIQVNQADAVARADALITAAIAGLDTADASVMSSIQAQEELITFYDNAPANRDIVKQYTELAEQVLEAPAEGVDANNNGLDDLAEWEASYKIDTDEDGLPDRAEEEIAQIFQAAQDSGYAPFSALAVTFDPRNPDSTGLDNDNVVAHSKLGEMKQQLVTLDVAVDNLDRLRGQAAEGLAFLQEAAEKTLYTFDLQAIADASFGGDVDKATRAVGIYQGLCARCHTSGYSEGPAFAQEAGAGSLGPALWDGRPNVQFLTADDMKKFLSEGSQLGVGYGVNGIGRGYMPGFGTVLSEADLDLVIQYLRGEVLR
ncbi:MAG: cytochrome c [Acidimicrobiia bacterium]|nr:cytochrome c [Acidimicrobiia bacterium]